MPGSSATGGLRRYRCDSSPLGHGPRACVFGYAFVRVGACPLSALVWLCVLESHRNQIPVSRRLLISPLWPNLAAVVQYGVPSLIILPTEPHRLSK